MTSAFRRLGFCFASLMWSQASRLARALVRQGTLEPRHLGPLTVSIGNIQAGGAGKTPLVAFLANEAIVRQKNILILSRGYRSKWERSTGVLMPDELPPNANLCGDEVALLRELAPKAAIAVGADRVLAFEQAAKLFALRGQNIDLVVLDDGFQNWKIRKDIEIVALTAKKSGEVVFRDTASALRFADLVVWTKGIGEPPAYANVPAPKRCRIEMSLKQAATPQSVLLVTAVGDSRDVKESVELAGYVVKAHRAFGDHFAFDKDSVLKITDEAHKLGAKILVTGKDWVKLKKLAENPDHFIVVEPTVKFTDGRANWDRVLWSSN